MPVIRELSHNFHRAIRGFSGRPKFSLDQHRLEHGQFVRHEPIDAEVDQAVHFGRIVDGPDMHLKAEFMGTGYERPVDEAYAPLMDGKLGAAPGKTAPQETEGPAPARQAQPRRINPPKSGAEPGTQRLTDQARAPA